MSIYATLGFPIPLISYSIMHRPRVGVSREDYEATIREMHIRIAEESAAVEEQCSRTVAEISQRQAQMLRGTLWQFLETPIRSDDAEVQRIFQETLDKFGEQTTERAPYGVIASVEGVVNLTGSKSVQVQRLEKNGRQYLRSLGLADAKEGALVYESVYTVRGARGLDVLEQLVRDRLGIYATSHGKHVADAECFTVAAHNCVQTFGIDYTSATPAAWGEAALFFAKPQISYEEFRQGLAPCLEGALAAVGIPSVTLWQRKLGLGRGAEFVLRLPLREKHQLGACLEHLRSQKEPAFVQSSILGEGSLVVKEILYPRA